MFRNPICTKLTQAKANPRQILDLDTLDHLLFPQARLLGMESHHPDLVAALGQTFAQSVNFERRAAELQLGVIGVGDLEQIHDRSEERRVGKECS